MIKTITTCNLCDKEFKLDCGKGNVLKLFSFQAKVLKELGLSLPDEFGIIHLCDRCKEKIIFSWLDGEVFKYCKKCDNTGKIKVKDFYGYNNDYMWEDVKCECKK